MFHAMLRAQWIWSRALMLAFLAAGFALPVVSVPLTQRGAFGLISASSFVGVGESVGLLVAITVCVASIALVLQDWSADERGHHIYTLSLPIERRRYLAYRLGGGFLLLALLALAVWVGGLAASWLLELPESLRTYPASLALRALMSAWLVHALAFLVRFGFGFRAQRALAAGILVVVVLLLLPVESLPGLLQWISLGARALVQPHGPLGILVSQWSFIDV